LVDGVGGALLISHARQDPRPPRGVRHGVPVRRRPRRQRLLWGALSG